MFLIAERSKLFVCWFVEAEADGHSAHQVRPLQLLHQERRLHPAPQAHAPGRGHPGGRRGGDDVGRGT